MQVRKLLSIAVVAAATAFVAGAGIAQSNYPSQPIRVIIPLASNRSNRGAHVPRGK